MPKRRLCLLALTLATASCSEPSGPPPVRWSEQPSGTRASLRGVCAVDTETCWASGSDGTCLRTTDGGRSWQKLWISEADALDFRDVHALDAHRAWLLTAGTPARIYHTVDGGETWIIQHEAADEAAFYDSFAFWDHQRAVAFGDPIDDAFDLLVTANGGQTWTRPTRRAAPAPLKGEAGFAASGTCVAVTGADLGWIGTGGKAARVLRTVDGGRSWQAASTPILAGWPSAGIFSIAFRDEDHGVVVGGDYLDPDNPLRNAAFSHDGGKTWLPTTRSGPAGYRSCVAAWPGYPGTWLTVGPNGCDESSDDGRSWSTISRVGYHSLAFEASGRAGWAVGSDGRIARITR